MRATTSLPSPKTLLALRTLLRLDALTCVLMGAVLLLASGPIAALTSIPALLLFWAGASLLPIAAFMALSARARPVPGWAVNLVVLGNGLWAAASIILPASGVIAPNALGWGFLLAQAAVVALLAWLELEAARGDTVAA